ncbi:YncE family protein, partial [Streptomyces sp. GbtcB7]|uniref:YncE family protein n=1 Tax=Streptomyces sp. GbtcB7 TaxID=2824752 RepID=UPI0034D6C88B
DTATTTVTPNLLAGLAPIGLAISPDGTRAYVTDNVQANVRVIDTSTSTVIGTPIPVGPSPDEGAITPCGTPADAAGAASVSV